MFNFIDVIYFAWHNIWRSIFTKPSNTLWNKGSSGIFHQHINKPLPQELFTLAEKKTKVFLKTLHNVKGFLKNI
jgi:hypothetical protein